MLPALSRSPGFYSDKAIHLAEPPPHDDLTPSGRAWREYRDYVDAVKRVHDSRAEMPWRTRSGPLQYSSRLEVEVQETGARAFFFREDLGFRTAGWAKYQNNKLVDIQNKSAARGDAVTGQVQADGAYNQKESAAFAAAASYLSQSTRLVDDDVARGCAGWHLSDPLPLASLSSRSSVPLCRASRGGAQRRSHWTANRLRREARGVQS